LGIILIDGYQFGMIRGKSKYENNKRNDNGIK
jgi:hypothetical protein